jgi:ATP-dependent DNA helicase DinG
MAPDLGRPDATRARPADFFATSLARDHGLTGLDGLEQLEDPAPTLAHGDALPLMLTTPVADRIRREILRAGGREVCFLASVTAERTVVDARAVARGNHEAVLAAARASGPIAFRNGCPGGLMIHNHPSGSLEPSEADLAVAARLWEEGWGSAITDNLASRLYVVVEPPAPEPRTLLDPDALEALVAPGGALAQAHPSFEDRPGQREMLRRVAERFNEGGVEVVEAGTGTGKSLAYLLPAAAWALLNRGRTVISTNTINLQEQLVQKDLPLVRRLLGDGVQWELVKGRGNYVSIRRARLAAGDALSLFPDGRSEELSAIAEWTHTTDDGSLADLTFTPSEDVWDEVKSDPDVCLKSRCPHFAECFYQRSRRRAAQARLLVVNHHLLFSDLSVRRATDNYRQPAVLPAYERVVLDEAHNVEDAATSHMGAEATRSGLFRLLARLDRQGKGVLAAVRESLGGASEVDEMRQQMEERVLPAVEEARDALLALIEILEPLARSSDADGSAVRLGAAQGPPEPIANEAVRESLDRTLLAFGSLEREVAALRARLVAREGEVELEARALDLQSVERRLAAAQHSLRLVLDPGAAANDFVRWLEVRGRQPRENLVLAAAPVEAGRLLREALFRRMATVVLTSATLTTRGRFDFVRKRLGLAPEDVRDLENPLVVHETLVHSPFDFSAQSMLVVPTDLPDAGGPGSSELQAETARVTAELAELTGGGIFALFTSHRALRRVAELLRAAGIDARFPLFVHGEGSRIQLLDAFEKSGNGILLGTASFWEGVDVPGHPLRGLVIQKLPFRVPTEPITAARVEALEREGGDGFWDLLLPLAALRLKQGFGRLVRTRQDKGVVVLLDDRILRKRYGRYLRDSLPETPLRKGSWPELQHPLRAFYASP